MAKSALTESPCGRYAWSYDTQLKGVLRDGRTVGNVTKYSVTTSKHQSACMVRACAVLVDDVPRGCHDLARWYEERQG